MVLLGAYGELNLEAVTRLSRKAVY